jgi:hypothetical protein
MKTRAIACFLLVAWMSAEAYSAPLDAAADRTPSSRKIRYGFFGEWLWMRGFAQGYDYGITTDSVVYGTMSIVKERQNGNVPNPTMKSALGYRVWLSGINDEKSTSAAIAYTKLYSKAKSRKFSIELPAIGGSDPVVILGPNFVRAWNLGSGGSIDDSECQARLYSVLKQLDLSFQRALIDQPHFAFSGIAMIQGIILEESFRLIAHSDDFGGGSYGLAPFSEMKIHNNFRGFGPGLGIAAKARFLRYFSWDNLATMSLYWGQFSLNQYEQFHSADGAMALPPLFDAESEMRRTSIKSGIRLSSKIQFEGGKKQKVLFAIGYEVDYFPNQAQLLRFVPFDPSNLSFAAVKQKGDIAFHGVSGTAGFSF